MVVTCPLGMSIPTGPVSKHNPVLRVKWSKCGILARVQKQPRLARRTAEGGCPHMVRRCPHIVSQRVKETE